MDLVRSSRRGPMRVVLLLAGTLSLGLATVGLFLPILPTTPLLLVAAACYAKSSPRLHDWLLSNRLFGPVIRQWRESRSIPPRAKWISIVLVVICFGFSIVYGVEHIAWRVTLGLLAVSLIIFLGRMRTVPAGRTDSGQPCRDPQATRS